MPLTLGEVARRSRDGEGSMARRKHCISTVMPSQSRLRSPALISALRAACGGCAPKRACGRSQMESQGIGANYTLLHTFLAPLCKESWRQSKTKLKPSEAGVGSILRGRTGEYSGSFPLSAGNGMEMLSSDVAERYEPVLTRLRDCKCAIFEQ